METELNSKDYVAFARRFVKETVATMDIDELRSIVSNYIHEDLQREYDEFGQVLVFETMCAWNSDVFDNVAKDYDLTIEDEEEL